MAKLRSTDDMMKDYLLSTSKKASDLSRDARIEAADPGYLNKPNVMVDPYGDQGRLLNDLVLVDKGRDLGEHLQDMGVGLMGTFGAIGNTAVLGVAAAGDGLERLVTGESRWEATQQALKDMNSTSEYWNSLQSEKSQAFDRISQYRQDKAIETAGQDADFIDRLTAGFSAAAGAYIDNPDQILTDGVSQLPYLLTGGVAKAATTGTGVMSPLVARLAQKMSVESAEKLVQMGIVGGLQGTIEGADAASSTYARVMASTDTFGPGQEGEKETAALKAAAEAFGIAGATSAITGTLASKFELSPFAAKGGSAIARTGDNIVKALQEGVQETIESGTSQFATNLAGNKVLKGDDLVALDEGVGGAAGTGFVVGMGSTAVTNPRSAVDAVIAPLTLAGKGFSYMGDRAVKAERTEDMAAAQATTDEIVANIKTPAMTAVMNQGVQQPAADGQTVDTPAEEVVLPPEIDTRTQVGLFATGMEYLRGKSMDSEDAVGAFHVLGSVLAAANNIRSLRDAAAVDAADESLPQEARDTASNQLTQLKALIRDDQLDKWVADFPMEDIESELEDLRQNPEAFGSAIAHLAAMNPLKMTNKVIEVALEAKSLPKTQRDSLLLAQELKAAEAELKVGTDPDSSEVSRSIMQTGFPGASNSKQSIADMLRNVTTALDQNDPESAQSYFNKLTAFSTYLTDRAGRFDQALKDMNASGEAAIDVPDTRTWVDGKLTDTPFRLVQGNANSLGVRIAARKDAETVAKMVAAMQKRTGLNVVTPAAKAPQKPVEAKAEKPAPKASVETKKPTAEAPKKPAAVDKTDPGNLSDKELDQQIAALEGKRKAADRLQYDILTKERDTRIAGTMSGIKQPKPKAVDKPVVKKAEPAPVAAAPVDNVILPKTGPYTAKDQAKSDKANKFIGRGSPGSSTAAYAKAWGDRANVGEYTENDVVFVSVNGNRPNALTPPWAEIKKAMLGNATLITDKPADRARPFNSGERLMAEFLGENGYFEKSPGEWVRVSEAAPVVAAPVSNESRITPEQAQQLSFKGLQARIDAITKKGIQNTTKEDDSTLAVLNEELDRRAEEALRRDEDNENPEPSDIDDNFEEPVGAQPVQLVTNAEPEFTEVEPSKNHITGLQPSYPVADGASVAEQNSAKNHLSQSFTTSDTPGLRSKGEALTNFSKLVEDTGIIDEDVPALEALFNTKEKLLQRMQQLIGIGGAAKAKHFLKNNVWEKAKYHFLYATQWNEKKGIQYQKEIAEIMAWTGVQHLMDMVAPVSWSNDLIQKLQSTYGSDIREKMLDGWVPLKEQTEQMARKLQTNLELKGDKKVSVEYTEGTMLALAGRIIESMIVSPNYNGVIQHQTIMTLPVYDKENPNVVVQPALPIQWVRMAVNKDSQKNADMLYAAARILQDFLPERTSTNQAHVGTSPKGVNPYYRGSLQKIGKEQKAALKARANVKHMLSPLLHNMWQALPQTEQFFRLFGMDMSVKDFPTNKRDLTVSQIGRKGANNTTYSDLRVIHNHIQKLKDFAEAQEGDVDLHSIPSFFEYEQVSNGRAMTKGTSPQSSKWYREMFAIAQYQVDPTKENRGFRMAVAQGFGIKMDIQHIDESLQKLEVLLTKPDMQRALQAAERFGEKFDYSDNALLLEADLAAFEQLANPEGLGIELSPHAMSALVHYAQYQKPGRQPFTSSLMYEIDGKTDGPINLMMLLGLKGSAADMEAMLGLAGLFFDHDGSPIAVQDMTAQLKAWNNNKKDLYEIITGKAQTLTPKLYNDILKTVVDKAEPKFKHSVEEQASYLMDATLHLVRLAGLGKFNAESLLTEYERAFSKKSTQAAGYLQGGWSVSTDLFNTIIEKISELKDADKLTNGDKEAIKVFFTYALGSTKGGGAYFSYSPKAYKDHQGRPFVWEGKPLNKQQQDTAISTLNTFIGNALFTGLEDTIGLQRANMLNAVTAMSAHISYADHVLRTRYIAKQKELTDKGELLPGQALSKVDEQVIVKDVWEKLVPHPLLRNTAGLPTASLGRNNGNPLTGSLKLNGSRRIENRYFEAGMGEVFSHFSGLTEVMFEDPGVSFAALSIMTAGDGSMMTGLFNKMRENILDMYDGLYMSPEIIDEMGDALNHEVKANWEHDFIGSILASAKSLTTSEFKAWASSIPAGKDRTLLDNVAEAEAQLRKQREQQIKTLADINSRPHWVSHMAGHSKPAYFPGKPLNSTTLGTSITDPLLDLAADELGHEINGIRKLSAADVKSLLNNHTFENPLLKGLWNVLAPLVSNNLMLYMSSDKQGLADFYQQNERREMGSDVNGISIGDRVYVRTINAETIVHELLHATTKNLTATFFANPASLTDQQRAAMTDLKVLANEFAKIDPETLPVSQAPMVAHVQAIMRGYVAKGDLNSAMQEFLAYSLTNYQIQRTLGATKSRLGELLDSVFAAIKKMFGFPNGNMSDSMLAHLLSNFEALTDQAVDRVYPISVETALESVNPQLARSFAEVLTRLEKRSATFGKQLGARVDGVTRMQELAKTNLFPTMTNDQLSAGAYLQAMFSVGLQFKAADNALLARVVDAVRDEGPKAWGTDPVLAQARYDFFFENTSNTHDRAADILSMGLVNPEFASYLEKIVLPKQQIDKRGLNNWLDSSAKAVYELMDTGLVLKGSATLGDALEVATLRIRKSMLDSIKRQETKPGAYRKLTDKLSEGVHLIGEKVGKQADARLAANQTWIGSGLMIVAGLANTNYADMVGKLVLSYSNHMEGLNPAREVIQELVGTNGDNFKLIQLKGIAARMVSAIRQNFREQTPVTVKSWFKDLSPEQDALLHKVIGKFATYSLSQNLKDRMEELLTDPTNARADAELLLMSSGNRTKRLLMIKYARMLGDRMANQGNQALYLNTRAVAGLAVHGGGDVLTDVEMAALESLSTLQALSYLTPSERRQTLALYRDNTEGFWKTTALIDSFYQFDTQRAGKNTATLNMQKGWIPVESDGRKKLKLFQKSEIRKAERMGWVQVGEFKDDPTMVYMATTIGKTPTLSGGAIHAVDFHMNGIHYHSGMPTDPSIQTIITHPKAVTEIRNRILNGEVMPYTALYDAAGDVEGFQRLLDPAVVERHTKTVGRISDAAGIWLGRLHEERVAHGQNQVAADLLAKTWEEGKKDKREKEFVNIRQPLLHKHLTNSQDKVLMNVWETLPYHTKVQLETVFADGSKNPPIWIRRDQLNDAIGYHKASVSNFFTGDNRYEKSTNDNVAALSRQMLGKNAYKYLLTAEEGWQALIGSAKDTIIVKSLVVMLNNLTSNQIQLFMITGNPIWNLRVQSQKHKELVSYLGYQQRIARLKAEELSTADPKAIARVNAEQTFLKNEMRKLSIYPLIEAGEMPTIAEGLSETEEFSLVGDFTAWAEKQMGKMPPVVGTIINNLAVSKETSLYKGLDRGVQYGDFVAKAAMYEWLTTQDKAAKTEALELMKNDNTLKWADAIHIVALKEVNDEFVNYARLPGRTRTYGEDMGLLWFYNYKIRIMKMAFRRMRKNPAAFLIGSQVGSVLGIATLVDTLPWNINFAYSTGLDPLMSAHETIIWNQLL